MKFSQLLRKADMKTLFLGMLLGVLICRNLLCSCSLKEEFAEGMEHDGGMPPETMDHDGGVDEEEEEEEKGADAPMPESMEGMEHNSAMSPESMDHDGGVEEEEEEEEKGVSAKGGIADKVENFASRILSKFSRGKEGFASVGAPVMGGVDGSYEQVGTNSAWRENAGNAYQGTPVPLPSGEMFFFAGNKFTPNCRSSYSSSTGQACLSNEQIQYLNQRAGNRTLSDDM